MCKVDSDKVDSDKVDSDKVDSDKVDSDKVDSDKVDSDKVDSDKVDSDKVDSDKVDSDKVDSDKVDSDKVDSDKVDSDKVDSDKVDFDKVDSDKVDSDKVDFNNVRDIIELEKIWDAKQFSFGIKYFVIPFLFFMLLFLLSLLVLIAIVGPVFLIIFSIYTIYSYLSGSGNLNNVIFLLVAGVGVFFISLRLLLHSGIDSLFGVEPVNEWRLIRFKISPLGIDISAYNSNILEALTRTLKRRGSISSSKRYEIEKLTPNQLTLALKYLSKKHQIVTSPSNYLQFISLGVLTNSEKPDEPKYIRCYFVMLDRKDSEVLLYSKSIQEWPYIREVLEEGGFTISDVSDTMLDLELYEIKEDGTVTRRDKRRSYFGAIVSNYYHILLSTYF